MYDDLVEALRRMANTWLAEEYKVCAEAVRFLTREAADAIEELRKHEADMSHNMAALSLRVLRAEEKTPRWIPVTERLPGEKINPNTRDFEYVLCTTIWGDVRPFKYGTPVGNKDAHFWNGAGYVDAYVTHWMPLPAPPKEE